MVKVIARYRLPECVRLFTSRYRYRVSTDLPPPNLLKMRVELGLGVDPLNALRYNHIAIGVDDEGNVTVYDLRPE